MKIISGRYKGRNLLGFNIDGTRPTMDRVKESLFAMIQHYIDGADVLDLFAGSGNLGIEALSEGADVAYLVDKNRKACKIIQSNLHNLKIESANVFCMDYLQALKQFASNKNCFDIIFIDPPYQTELVKKSIESIIQLDVLSKEGIIVAESDKLEKIVFPACLEIVKSKKDGDKWVAILQYV